MHMKWTQEDEEHGHGIGRDLRHFDLKWIRVYNGFSILFSSLIIVFLVSKMLGQQSELALATSCQCLMGGFDIDAMEK
jgi:hypothetical protein